jgi:predicted enzyme related to lactoylglutathione lyase
MMTASLELGNISASDERGTTMGDPVVHFEIYGKDRETLAKFYGDLFGWNLQSQPELQYVTIDTASGAGINGGFATNEEKPQIIFYVEVPDIQASLDKIESLGGKTVAPPMEIPNVVTFAQFSDPHGNLIGLVQGGGPETPGVSPGSNPPIAWFEVLGSNVSELADFYAKAFDWKVKKSEGAGIEYVDIDTESGRGIPGGIGSNPATQNIVTVYAKVDDIGKYLSKANELGAKTVIEPRDVGEQTTIANIQDPQGNIFGLFQLQT